MSAVRNLLQTGVRMLVDMERRMAGLIDSETRLYGTVQQLAEKVQELTEAQKRTEESLRRFLDRSGNGQTS